MKNQTKLIYPFLGSKPIGKHWRFLKGGTSKGPAIL